MESEAAKVKPVATTLNRDKSGDGRGFDLKVDRRSVCDGSAPDSRVNLLVRGKQVLNEGRVEE